VCSTGVFVTQEAPELIQALESLRPFDAAYTHVFQSMFYDCYTRCEVWPVIVILPLACMLQRIRFFYESVSPKQCLEANRPISSIAGSSGTSSHAARGARCKWARRASWGRGAVWATALSLRIQQSGTIPLCLSPTGMRQPCRGTVACQSSAS
jgi:hypothetical protein